MGKGPSSYPHELPSYKRRRKIYVACETMDFVFDEDEVKKFDEMWREGISMQRMAIEFDRTVDEIAILVIDRAGQGHIQPRYGGAFGWLGHIAAVN